MLYAALALLLIGTNAEARVFNFKDTSLAAYVRGNFGMSSVGKDAFKDSSGAGTRIDGSSRFAYGGEFGAMLPFGPDFHLRLGAEIIQHQGVDAPGVNSAGDELFQLQSSVFVFNPNVTAEYAYRTGARLRYYMAAGVGYADITVENKYRMTGAGAGEFGVGDHTEKLTAQTLSGHVLLGFETMFVDSTTLSFDVGYRYLPVAALKHKTSESTIVHPGGTEKGADADNHDGGTRKLNLGGPYAGMTLKFYLNFL